MSTVDLLLVIGILIAFLLLLFAILLEIDGVLRYWRRGR
jgi:hypothetical protein